MVSLFSALGRFAGARQETSDPPETTGFQGAVAVHCPMRGRIVELSAVPDEAFAQGLLGDGLAIDPSEDRLSAPCDAEVSAIHASRHAVTLRLANGAELLMHIGIDTVALGGQGFTAHVRAGQRVRRGDALITVNRKAVSGRARSMLVPIVVTSEGHRVTRKTENRGMADETVLFHVETAPSAPDSTAPDSTAPDAAAAPPQEHRGTFRVGDPTGIHARPAGRIADCARRHGATIVFVANGRKANARSPVNLMLLGLFAGDAVEVVVTGGDATILDEMRRLVEDEGEAPVSHPPAFEFPVAESAPVLRPPALHTLSPDAHAVLKGVQAVSGLATGTVRHVFRRRLTVVEQGDGVEVEARRLDMALVACREELQRAIEDARVSNRQQAEILKAHLSFLDDPDLADIARDLISQDKSAGFAWKCATSQQAAALKRLGNARLAERAADLLDVEQRVLSAMAGDGGAEDILPEDSIVVADDLLPSQLIGMERGCIAGLCLAEGGPTSHVAILAASLGIPTLVAMGSDILRIPDGVPAILDADHQRLEINPSGQDRERMADQIERRRVRLNEARLRATEECRTADGTRIEVAANLASPSDVLSAVANGAEGCGLLRSEFLFLERSTAPTEDEQLVQYQAVADALGDRPLVIRTLDAGADKVLPYLDLGKEENPALGRRGVRVSLWRPDTLRAQLRAILRVQSPGRVRIMVPMVATVEEVRQVRTILDAECAALGLAEGVPLGIMVEVPSVAVQAHVFARYCDFFSIGTNDLTQYTLAMDRMNAHLAESADGLDPAVLRLIESSAAGAAAHGRWTGVCGGLASIPLAAPLLIGLGVRKLSATASSIPEIKAIVRGVTLAECQEVARQAVALESAAAVRALLLDRWPDV